MMFMRLARGPWRDGLWHLAFKLFKFLWLTQACGQEVPMTEKKSFVAPISAMNGAGPILGFSGL